MCVKKPFSCSDAAPLGVPCYHRFFTERWHGGGLKSVKGSPSDNPMAAVMDDRGSNEKKNFL